MPPPTKTRPGLLARAVQARQTVTVTATPSTQDNSSSGSQLSGGAIAGIVIGSICGFLLLWWILRSLFNLGGPKQEPREAAWYDDVGARGRSRRHRSGGGHGHRRSGSYYVQETHGKPRRSSREMRVVEPVYAEPRRPSKTYVVRD